MRGAFFAAGAAFFEAAAFFAGALFTTIVLTGVFRAAVFLAAGLALAALASCSAARIAVFAALERRSEVLFLAAGTLSSLALAGAAGLEAPSLVRTGLSPQISSRW